MEMQIPWWWYVKDAVLLCTDAVLIGALVWVAWIYRTDARATKNQLDGLQKNQDALLSQANTLKTHIETNLQLVDRLKSEELVKEVESARRAYAVITEAKVEANVAEIRQRLTMERDEALKGKEKMEEWVKSFAVTAKDMADQAAEASFVLGVALYRLPEQYRTMLLGSLKNVAVKDRAVAMFKLLEEKFGPSPIDRPYGELALSALAATAPSPPGPLASAFLGYALTQGPQPTRQAPSDTGGMVQAPPDPR